MSVSKRCPGVSEDAPSNHEHAPRPLTLGENVVLTIKVLAGLGLLGVVLWAGKFLTAAK